MTLDNSSPNNNSRPKSNKIMKIVGWSLGLVAGGLLLISLIVNLFLLILAIINFKIMSMETIAYRQEGYKEELIAGKGTDKIIVVPITGVILNQEDKGIFFGSYGTTAEDVISQLKSAQEDADVKAVILRINSPGGGITASDMIYSQVLKVRESGKKVVAFMEDVSASGGYYIAAAADRIVAHSTTITGSIGVIIEWANIEGLCQKIGLQEENIKSGSKKDMLSATRAITEEERQILQEIIDQMYSRFINVVARGRNMSLEQVKNLSDGRIYTGEQALKNGLVDMNGYFDDAVELTKNLAGLDEASVIKYRKKAVFLADLFESALSPRHINLGVNLDMRDFFVAGTPRFMYLWKVGK